MLHNAVEEVKGPAKRLEEGTWYSLAALQLVLIRGPCKKEASEEEAGKGRRLPKGTQSRPPDNHGPRTQLMLARSPICMWRESSQRGMGVTDVWRPAWKGKDQLNSLLIVCEDSQSSRGGYLGVGSWPLGFFLVTDEATWRRSETFQPDKKEVRWL